MVEPEAAPYGAWKSPITADVVIEKFVGLSQIVLDGEDAYWVEQRPQEEGRYVIVRRTPDGQTTDLTPAGFNARTRVHEYGGGSYIVADGTLYFSNFVDQLLYRQLPGSPPQPLTPPGLRYADAIFDSRRGRLVCVREDHTGPGQAVNTLVSLNVNGDESGGRVLAAGNDFYSSPRLSPDGNRLAWLTWNHPNMPWDGTELWAADLRKDGLVANAQCVAGGLTESIFQPEWSPDGLLYFISDRTGWWNLYCLKGGQAVALCPMQAEFGEPQWVFGMSTYGFESAGRIMCAYIQNGASALASLDTQTLKLEQLETPYTEIGQVRAAPGKVVFVGGSPTLPGAIAQLDLATRKLEVLRQSRAVTIDPGYFSRPQPIEFPTEGGLTAHGFFYPPRNRDYVGLPDEKPPLLVMSHGGPTGSASITFRYGIQFWTSRGIAVLDVDYGGSTGYGRAYRERLKGNWGIVDVDDCVNGARYLVERGKVDGNQLAITGGSAGGYTTLATLTFRDAFKAGASHYGISDLEALAQETHKFESRYLDTLIGPYPERRDLYLARSPIHFVYQLDAALILLQGSEDKVVPPNQAEMMFEAVRAKELPVAYVLFEGEQHGFRKAENIKRALEAEIYFYSKVFGFELADKVEPVEIENL